MRGGGEQGLFAHEREAGILGKKQLNATEVFLGFEAARGIKEGAAGLKQGDRAFQDGVLKYGELGEARFREAPRDVRASADDAGIRAGDVRENEIE